MTVLEDTQDKVRRNVVIVAGAIFLIQFLDVQINQTVTIGWLSATNISTIKFWSAATVVMTYLSLRYWFDEQTTKAKRNAVDEFWSLAQGRLGFYFQWIVHEELWEGRSAKAFKDLHKSVLAMRAGMAESDKPSNTTLEVKPHGGFWNSEGFAQVRMLRGNGSTVFNSDKIGYKMQLYDLFNCLPRAFVRAVFFSKGSVDYLVPVGMGLSAIGLCLYKLVAAILK